MKYLNFIILYFIFINLLILYFLRGGDGKVKTKKYDKNYLTTYSFKI